MKKVTVGNLDIWQVQHGVSGALIKLQMLYAAGGDYSFSGSIDSPGAVWSFNDPTQTVSPPSVTGALKTKVQQLTVSLNNTATAATSQTWMLTVVAQKTNTDGDSGPFSSSFSFPIGIF